MVFGNLRISSSLQDLSSFRHNSNNLDPEHGLLREPTFSKTKPVQLPNPVRHRECLFLFFFLFLFALYSHRSSPKYYVVLDSGSTGTRVHVYKAQTQRTTLPITVQPVSGKTSPAAAPTTAWKTEPGLDKLFHNSTGLKSALKPLLKWAQKQIPEGSHKSTSLFLYATAGVRRLPFDDSKWVLDNAWNVLKASPFLCRRDWVKIISGTEEAYFGWIALNYGTGVLGVNPRKETYGALDLGGSSLQVTFEGGNSKQQLFNSDTSLIVRIGSVNHHLTAYSLAGYGLNEAFNKSVGHVFKEFGYSIAAVVKGNVNPCLQSGYKEQYTCSHCSVVEKEGESSRIEGNGNGNGNVLRTVVTLVSVPNWHECRALAKVAVNLSEWSDASPDLDCEVQPFVPLPMGHFM